ncbi:MAG: hypothetical protein ACOZF0_23620 [Thermodesulfobacteriota bacterium]
MISYSYRRYRPGDERAVNGLYQLLTGRIRSTAAYRWQWFHNPADRSEIWLIEAGQNEGDRVLIGHHGIMPIPFSMGREDLLFGKTENTFVHPDYRSRILYPRFESRFRQEYEGRFHALFSTMGSEEAIRQRKAQGYHFAAAWKQYCWSVHPVSDAFFLVAALRERFVSSFQQKTGRQKAGLPSKRNPAGKWKHLNVEITCHMPPETERVDFFKTFWKSVRHRYGITPSRNYRELRWRFWDNPYISYMTLIMNEPNAGSGLAFICEPMPGMMRIDDFIVSHPQTELYGFLLNALLQWAGRQGAKFVQFTTTDDSIEWIGRANFNPGVREILLPVIMNRYRKKELKMPRKICAAGRNAGLQDRGWYITPMVFEGIQ